MSHRGNGRDLRHGFDQDHARDDRVAREVARLVPLVTGEGVFRDGADARLELDDAVDQKERITVRNERLDPGLVELRHRGESR